MDLLKGVVVVIDNEVNIEESIIKIVDKIQSNNIPLVSFDSIDAAEKCLPHLQNP